MALPETINYTPTPWVNGQAPAINDINLNHIEQGIATAYTTLNALITDISNNYYTKAEVYNKDQVYMKTETYSKEYIDSCFIEVTVDPD